MLVVRPAHRAAVDADERPLDELGENANDAAGTDVVASAIVASSNARSTGPPISETRWNTANSASSSRAIVLSTTPSMSSVAKPSVVEALAAETVGEIGQRDLGGLARRQLDPQRDAPDARQIVAIADRAASSSGNVTPAADA